MQFELLPLVIKYGGLLGVILVILYLIVRLQNLNFERFLTVQRADREAERAERDAERKAEKLERDEDRKEHMLKWDAMIRSHATSTDLLTRAHREETDRVYRLLDRQTETGELHAKLLAVINQKIDANQSCPIQRQKGNG